MTWMALAAAVWTAAALAAGLLIGKAAALDEKYADMEPPEPVTERLALLR